MTMLGHLYPLQPSKDSSFTSPQTLPPTVRIVIMMKGSQRDEMKGSTKMARKGWSAQSGRIRPYLQPPTKLVRALSHQIHHPHKRISALFVAKINFLYHFEQYQYFDQHSDKVNFWFQYWKITPLMIRKCLVMLGNGIIKCWVTIARDPLSVWWVLCDVIKTGVQKYYVEGMCL